MDADTAHRNRSYVEDNLKHLHIDYSESSTIYQKTTFAINATIFALSSAGIWYTVNQSLGLSHSIWFFGAIVVTLGGLMLSKAFYRKDRDQINTMILTIHDRFIDDPHTIRSTSEEQLREDMATIFAPNHETNRTIKWVNILSRTLEFLAPVFVIVGLSCVVF